MAVHLAKSYRWDVRFQLPKRPDWFTSWPGGNRLALYIIVLHEWETTPVHRSRPMPADAHHKLDFHALGAREYGARHGIWRLMSVLQSHDVKATVVSNGLMAELFPDGLQAAAAQGHEVASHQWDQTIFPTRFQTRDEEKSALVRSKEILESASRAKVRGYISPGPWPSPNTLELLAETGFEWTGDYVDSDFPYFIYVADKKLLAVPYATPGSTDFELISYSLPERLNHLKYLFDATYRESALQPMSFCYAVHSHWGGSVGMASMLSDFLDYVRAFEGVWIARCGDVADFWNLSSHALERSNDN